MRRIRSHEAGFTLIELAVTISIMGIIMVPLTNFLISYFQNSVQVQDRLGDSHDIQITAAYFSQDVANTGVQSYAGTPPESLATPTQSVWVNSAPPPCRSTLGKAVLLLKSDVWRTQDTPTVQSVAYVVEGNALHRVVCSDDSKLQSDITVVHNFESAEVQCSTSCTADTPPDTINLIVTIQANSGDTTGTSATFTGQRRQSS